MIIMNTVLQPSYRSVLVGAYKPHPIIKVFFNCGDRQFFLGGRGVVFLLANYKKKAFYLLQICLHD